MLTTKELETLTPEERAAYEEGSVIDRVNFTTAWRRNAAVSDYRSGPKPPTSVMRMVGSVGTVAFFLVAFFAGVVAMGGPSGSEDATFWFVLSSSLFGISVFMWMLGAIEHRLILINETLKRQG